MDSGIFEWFGFFFNFIYNALYSIKFPGLGIRMIYVLILASLLYLLFGIFRRLLFSPLKGGRNARVKGDKNANTS